MNCGLNPSDETILHITDDRGEKTEQNEPFKSDYNKLRFFVTNARSLTNKIDSMVQNFNELGVSFGLVTESWLSTGEKLKHELDNLENGNGLGMIVRNRDRAISHNVTRYDKSKRTRGGGVVIAYRKAEANFKEVPIPGNRFEAVAALGNFNGTKRKVLAISVYVPPKMLAKSYSTLTECVTNLIATIKTKESNPAIIIGGDFNKRDPTPITDPFPDLRVITTEATRKNETLDLVITNLHENVDAQVCAPLRSSAGVESDHSIISVDAIFKKGTGGSWRTYKARKRTEAGYTQFKQMVTAEEWTDVIKDGLTNSERADNLRRRLDKFMDTCFPITTYRTRATDKPWITHGIRKKIDDRRKIYRRTKSRQTSDWHILKTTTDRMIKEKKQEYIKNIRRRAKEKNDSSLYFGLLKEFSDEEKPPTWDIRSLFPDEDDSAVGEKVADFFNNISTEYCPLRRRYFIPEEKIILENHEVAQMLKSCKKTNSRVPGDIYPTLVTELSDILAIPLTVIFNRTLAGEEWPELWKRETVVVIPKTKIPDSLSQCRNLSCTPLFSKVLERIIFKRLTAEAPLSERQYGGIKKCGVDHFLVDSWNTILTDLDEHGSASNIVSLDFEKAFNRLDHSACIAALEAKGVSQTTLTLVSSFLEDRTMQVRINDTMSVPRAVHGGSPQGSILGSLLFTLTTDDLTSGFTNADSGDTMESITTMEGEEPFLVDPSLARITTPIRSDLGIDNFTVEASTEEICVPFERNGSWTDENDLGNSQIQHPNYTQSTPTTRGQFVRFSPPGNLITDCISGSSGESVVHMRRPCFRHVIAASDSTMSTNNESPSIETCKAERNQRKGVAPFVYIDDTNGIEKLSNRSGRLHMTTKKTSSRLHARSSEAFFKCAGNEDQSTQNPDGLYVGVHGV